VTWEEESKGPKYSVTYYMDSSKVSIIKDSGVMMICPISDAALMTVTWRRQKRENYV